MKRSSGWRAWSWATKTANTTGTTAVTSTVPCSFQTSGSGGAEAARASGSSMRSASVRRSGSNWRLNRNAISRLESAPPETAAATMMETSSQPKSAKRAFIDSATASPPSGHSV